jgi:hypothetical protein
MALMSTKANTKASYKGPITCNTQLHTTSFHIPSTKAPSQPRTTTINNHQQEHQTITRKNPKSSRFIRTPKFEKQLGEASLPHEGGKPTSNTKTNQARSRS